MSYLNKSLGEGEVVRYIARKHWIVYLVPVLLTMVGIVFPPLLLVSVPWLVVAWIIQKTTELAVTNRKVVAKWGLIARRTVEQRLDKVDSIQVDQSITGRVLGFGTIQVHGSGLSMTPISIIADPLQFRRKVEEAIELRKVAA